MKYQRYLNNLDMTYEKAYGKCKDVSEEMLKHFPELRLARGHYYCHKWGERMHHWLVTPEGKIIDPTKIQFPSNGFGVYEEWDETQQEPTGMCPNCGEYIYDGRHVHEECEGAFIASLYA